MMIRLARPRFALLALAIGLVASACADATEPPPDGLLDHLDAITLRDAIIERAQVVQASAGASRVFWFALRSLDADFGLDPAVPAAARAPALATLSAATGAAPTPMSDRRVGVVPLATIPAQHYGRTFVYEPDAQEWIADEDRAGAPADGIRVTWYEITSTNAIRTPLIERGHIDLVDLPDVQGARLGVTVFRMSADQVVADYILDLEEIETAEEWSAALEITGTVSVDPTSLDVAVSFEGSENTATGEEASRYSFTLAEPGFLFGFDVTRDVNNLTDAVAESVAVLVTIDGTTTSFELEGSGTGGAFSAAGPLHHDGVHVADVTASGLGITYSHPDGAPLGTSDRQKVDTVVQIFIQALSIINTFFG